VSVARLIQSLNDLHVELSLDDGRLRVNAPRGVLTAELREEIRANRDLITSLLQGASAPDATPLPALISTDRGEPAPLTPAQHQLWFLDRLDPGGAFLNVPLTLRLRGKLDIDALSWVVSELGRRHDALTSKVIEYGDEPFQQPCGADLRLEFEDYSHLEPAPRERTVQARLHEELVRPFDFDARAPLARFTLLRASRTEHLLSIVANHVVFDGPSQDILVSELQDLYAARVLGRPMPPPPAARFADFAHWQKRVREHPGRSPQLQYWQNKLSGMPLQLDLPLDRARPKQASHRSHHVHCWLERGLCDALRRVARAQSVTVNMVALASVQTLLWRYSGQSDFGIGMPLQNRNHPGFERLIGMFLNTVVLRAQLDGDTAFAALLQRVRDSQIEALSHGNVSFDELLQILSPGRSAQKSQLFQVFYSYQDGGQPRSQLGDVALENEPSFTGFAMTDLTFWVRDHGDGMWLALEGASDLFEAETCNRFFRSWRRLLEAIADDPSLTLGQLPAMSAEDEVHVVHELNDTARPWDDGTLVHRMFERAVDRRPDTVALLFEDQSITFRELDQRANRLAHYLVERGVGPESLVGLCVHKSIEQVVAMLAILKAGGAYVGLDPTYPAARISQLLADSEAGLLISSSDIAPSIETTAQIFLIDRDASELELQPATRLQRAESPEQLAYIIYTSGSSGTPKGVMVEHRNVTSFFQAVSLAIELDDQGVWLAGASISFDMSVIEILGSLCYGRRLVLLGDSVLGQPRDPRYAIPELVARHGVTHFQCTPSQAQMLLLEPAGRAALGSLGQLLCGGEAVPQELADELCALVRGEVINIYGPTETTVYATLGPMRLGERVNIGRPIANTRLFVLDAAGKPVPKGAPGELYIGSPGVTRGYLKRPELSAERFVVNTIRPDVSARLYRSGDLVRYAADGTLLYLGRNDNQVKIRGYRIELGEIESAARRLPGVREALVVARGKGAERRLVGYLVTGDEYQGDDALRDALRAKLPEFMVPRLLVHLPAIPLNSNGKVDRLALPEPSEAALPAVTHVPPRDERERRLCEIWRKALGVSRVGLTDNFFDLGGHSLLAVKISNEVERSFGMRLPLSALFECPTVEHFARRLNELEQRRTQAHLVPWSTLVPIQPRGSLPPLFCVAGVGGNPMNLRHVASALGDEQPFYGLQFRGVDGQQAPHRRMRDMAEEFLNDIRRVQPQGPYYLGGYSAGGLAAYEMAQLLLLRGERVGLVVFFDTQNPVLPSWPMLERFDAHLQNYRRQGLQYLPSRLAARFNEELERAVRAVRARLARSSPFKYRHDAVWHASEEAIRSYAPEPYPGQVLLLRADARLSADGGIGYRPHESNGWRDYIQDLSVVELPCSHRDIVNTGSAELAARALKGALAAARARYHTTGSEAPRSIRPTSNIAELLPAESGGVRLTG
jgi:amino acid adenylation domain-containing protein